MHAGQTLLNGLARAHMPERPECRPGCLLIRQRLDDDPVVWRLAEHRQQSQRSPEPWLLRGRDLSRRAPHSPHSLPKPAFDGGDSHGRTRVGEPAFDPVPDRGLGESAGGAHHDHLFGHGVRFIGSGQLISELGALKTLHAHERRAVLGTLLE